MKSIKKKLFLGIIFIISIFIFGILSFSFLFKPYFLNSKISELYDVISSIDTFLSSNALDDNIQHINDLCDKYNLQIQIIDKKKEKSIYGSHGGSKNSQSMNSNRFQFIKTLSINDNVIQSIILDKSTGVEFLSAEKVENSLGYTINIKTPISAIDDSLHKAVILLSVILIPITILSLIATSIFAKKFTNPIILITDKASKIENLDFGSSINIDSKDEIGVLANTINNLSKKIEKTLNELTYKNTKLEEYIEKEKKNEVLRKEFVGSVSHELKTPITVISGYVQALDSGILKTPEDRSYYLSVIQDEIERMNIIVSDVLDLYKLESNTFKIDLKVVDIDILLNKILSKLNFKFKDFNINLKTNIEKAKVLGDSVRLEQAITNYINNALCHVDDNKEIVIKAINHENKVIVSVFNSGEKISPKDIDKIWIGFVRLDKVRNYKEKRVGLGLAIVKEIIKLHNGEKGIINTSKGVEFWLSLNSYSDD